MRQYKSLLLLAAMLLSGAVATAQQTYTVGDTIYNPKIVFTAAPSRYEIAGMRVEGVYNYEDNIIIGYSGLALGQRIEIPGDDLKTAAKRFWRQGLFSKVQIAVEKMTPDKAWLVFVLKQQPRVSQVNYTGMKGSERKDIQQRLGLAQLVLLAGQYALGVLQVGLGGVQADLLGQHLLLGLGQLGLLLVQVLVGLVQVVLLAGDLRHVDLIHIEILVHDVEHDQYEYQQKGAHQVGKAEPLHAVVAHPPMGVGASAAHGQTPFL